MKKRLFFEISIAIYFICSMLAHAVKDNESAIYYILCAIFGALWVKEN